MDLTELQCDSSYISTLFHIGIISRANLVNLRENAEFCANEWDWYKVPAKKFYMMRGQKDIMYLEMELKTGMGLEMWIPFRKVPKISFTMKFMAQSSSKIRGVC